MTNKYSIEELTETFLKHAEKADKDNIEWRKRAKEYPDDGLKDDDFNVARALYEICKELGRLKDEK